MVWALGVVEDEPLGQFLVDLIGCSIPDDHIDKRRFPLFLARDVLQALVAELKAENAGAPE